ncbi:MAG: DUF3325 domain-containing protein [Pseudomonadota bacterium]|jgi:uncharacterized protein (DUF697 family)
MVETTLYLMAAAAATLLGFAWLALSMEAHWRQVFGQAAPAARSRRILRVLGGSALLAVPGLCLLADRPSMAALVWVMLLAGGAVAAALMLAYRPRALRWTYPWALGRSA